MVWFWPFHHTLNQTCASSLSNTTVVATQPWYHFLRRPTRRATPSTWKSEAKIELHLPKTSSKMSLIGMRSGLPSLGQHLHVAVPCVNLVRQTPHRACSGVVLQTTSTRYASSWPELLKSSRKDSCTLFALSLVWTLCALDSTVSGATHSSTLHASHSPMLPHAGGSPLFSVQLCRLQPRPVRAHAQQQVCGGFPDRSMPRTLCGIHP
jgi:hypothetical protein